MNDGISAEKLLQLYEKSAANAIIVQGYVARNGGDKNGATVKTQGYDFSKFDSQLFLKSTKTKICKIDRLHFSIDDGQQLLKDHPGYGLLLEGCIAALAQHANQKGITTFWVSTSGFNNISPTGVIWELYIPYLKHVYKAIKIASPTNVVIADGGQLLYGKGGKGFFDVLGMSFRYGESPEKSVDVAKLVELHSAMVQNGDAAKRIFVTSWGGPDPFTARVKGCNSDDLECLKEFVVSGFRNLTTKTDTYDPGWIAGATYYPMNDFYKQDPGEVRWQSSEPKWYVRPGGLVDVDGKPKGDLLDVIYRII
jgi:hypothetical protein